MKTALDSLVGKTLFSVSISPGRSYIEIRTTDSDKLYLVADADCCSESWIEHAEIPFLIAKCGAVTEVRSRTVNLSWGSRQESDVLYYYELLLERGHVAFELRNSSNGYYGGDLVETTEERVAPLLSDGHWITSSF